MNVQISTGYARENFEKVQVITMFLTIFWHHFNNKPPAYPYQKEYQKKHKKIDWLFLCRVYFFILDRD